MSTWVMPLDYLLYYVFSELRSSFYSLRLLKFVTTTLVNPKEYSAALMFLFSFLA